jgi:aryl-alcohol dehydrogenase-like predicted oxidoreductase
MTMTDVSDLLGSRRPLGWTDVEVAPLALGTMQCGWSLSDVSSMELLDRYVEAGGNFVDTADMYGPNQNWRDYRRCKPHLGVSEDIIGRWMTDRRNRDTIVLATKVRARMWDGPDGEGLSRAHITRAVEDSLRRLRTDYIDLYQAHWPDDSVPLEETFSTFADLVSSGKVRYVGVSNYAALGQLDAVVALESLGYPRLASEQLRFNLLNRSEYEGKAERTLTDHHVATLCYSPLASGFLTGKHSRFGPAEESERRRFVAQYANDSGWQLIARLSELARGRGVSVAAVALTWVLSHPGVTAAVVGANGTSQLDDLVPAGTLVLEPADLAELTALGWKTSKPEYTSW